MDATQRQTFLTTTGRRWAQWALLTLAGLVAWGLFMMGAVLQRQFVVLFFPAGWCLYVAVRQYRLLVQASTPVSSTRRT